MPANSAQLPFLSMMPVSNWTPTPVEALPQDWSRVKRVSLDVETKDPDLHEMGCGAMRKDTFVAGYGLALDMGGGDLRGYYLPIRHDDGGNLDERIVLRYLRDRFKTYTGKIVGAELPYDMQYGLKDGIEFHPDARWYDVATDDALIDEYQDGFNLEKVAKRWGHAGKDERMLMAACSFYDSENPKRAIWRVHSKYVGVYGIQDVMQPLLIDDSQQPELEKQGLLRAADLEAQVLPVTCYTRRWGVRIDQDALESVDRWANEKQASYLAQFAHVTGIHLSPDDINSPVAVQALMGRLGLPALPYTVRYNKKTKRQELGQPSLKSEVLKAYRDPRIDLIRFARRLEKLLTTYIPSIRRYMVDGRIHGTLKSVRGSRDGESGEDSDDQTSGTISRRFAHVHPNLGNQPNPGRDADDLLLVEIGTRWRSIFRPDVGALGWGLADLSQQEPRHIIHFAEGQRLRGSHEMAEAFRRDSRTDNHDMVVKLTGLPRGPAKIAFLARCYGAGFAKIALQMEDKMRELDYYWKTDRGHKKAPKSWTPLPDNWQARVERHYAPGQWLPPNRCVGDPYWDASDECKAIIRQLDERLPYVKELADICKKRAEKMGGIRLMDGGFLRFERDPVTGRLKETHKALNKLAQGNGAIQMKLAYVALYRAGLLAQMTVHDDFSRSIGDTSELFRMKEIIENVIPYVPPDEYEAHPGPYKSRVPFLVKVKFGPSYGQADAADELMAA